MQTYCGEVRSITMQYLLRLSLLLVLLKIGNATPVPLECEVCYATNNTCSGPKQKCPHKKDTCVVYLSESTLDGKKIVTTEKGCEDSDVCVSPSINLYLGPERFYRGSLSCCSGDSCQNVSTKLPDRQTKPNGKQCPACYSWAKTCDTEVVNCTGLDTFCFDVKSRINIDGYSLNNIIKGCTTKSVCDLLANGHSLFWGTTETFENAQCSPKRSQGSLCTSCLPSTFFGLLLLKIFL